MSSFLEEIVVLSACVGTALAVVRHTSKVKKEILDGQELLKAQYLKEVKKLIDDRFLAFKATLQAENAAKSLKEKEIDNEIENLYAELDRFIKKIVEIDQTLNGREGLYIDVANNTKDIASLTKEIERIIKGWLC